MVGVIAAGALLAVVLGVIVFRGTTTRFDSWVFVELYRHVGLQGQVALIHFSDPVLSTGLMAAVALAAALARRWNVVALAVAGPLLALGLTEAVLKPVVGRLLGPLVLHGSSAGALPGSYPSGHETGVVSVATVTLIACAQLRAPRAVRAGVTVLLAAWVVVAAVGLVRGFFHYATDTIGALGVTVAIVLATALAVDALTPRLARSEPVGAIEQPVS